MATIKFRPAGLAKYRKVNGGEPSDLEFAQAIGVDRGTVYRLTAGLSDPGAKVIAGIVHAYGLEWFPDFFEVTEEAS